MVKDAHEDPIANIARGEGAHGPDAPAHFHKTAPHHVDRAQPPWFYTRLLTSPISLEIWKRQLRHRTAVLGACWRYSERAAAALPRSQARGTAPRSPAAALDSSYRECMAHSDISRVDVSTISVNRGSGTVAECDWDTNNRAICFTIVTARANLKSLIHGR